MANLSNINNILRTGSLGVGINRDPLGAFEISSATKPGIKMFNTATNGKTYEAYSDVSGNYIIYDQDADNNRFVINSAGNATFAGEISSGDDINVNNGKLVVNHTSAEVRIKSSSDTGESYINFSDPSDINPGQIYYGHSNNTMVFRVNDIGQMSLSNNLLVFPSTGVHEIRGDRGSGAFAIGNMGDASSQMMVSSRGFLTFNVSNTGSALSATERMRIGSNGYVGMGMDNNNNQRLALAQADSNGSHIRMNNSRSGGGYFVMGVGDTASNSSIVPAGGLFFYNGTTRMVINSSGNVGIGTATPTYKLVVSNGGASGLEFSPNAIAGLNEILSYNRSTSVYENLRLSVYGFEIYTNNGGNSLAISNTGRVGIGTTNPQAALDISSSYSIQGGVRTYAYQGNAAGTTNINLDITVGNEGGQGNVFKIEAGFAHYYAMNYNAVAEWWCTSRGTAVINTYILNAGSTLGGAWSASKPSTTVLRITKSAGTYGGTGKYWVKVTYVPF